MGESKQHDILEFAFADTTSFCSYVMEHGDGRCSIELVREVIGINRVNAKLVISALVDSYLVTSHEAIFTGTFESYKQNRNRLNSVFKFTSQKLRSAGLTLGQEVSSYVRASSLG